MPAEFDNRGKTFFVGKYAHTSFVLENHNGTMSFGSGGVNNQIPLLDHRLSQSYGAALEKAKEAHEIENGLTIAPENRSSSTIIAAPKVNACSVVLIKNRTSGDYFLLHHTPQDLERDQLYGPLFLSLNQGDEIDVVAAAGDLNRGLFLAGCQSKNIKINSSRIIPSKGLFNLEEFVIRGEPKSLHVTYDPADDRLMIFGDESRLDKKPSCYSAEGIFQSPEKQILMRRVSEITQYPSALDSGSGWNHFESRLPLTDKSFIKRVSQGKVDSLIEYEDENLEIAGALFEFLNEKEKETAQALGQSSLGQSFVINSSLSHLKDESHECHRFYDNLKHLSSIASKELGLQMPQSAIRPSSAANFREKVFASREGENSPARIVADGAIPSSATRLLIKRSPEKQVLAKPLYIFIGEQHDDFSNVSLVHQILKSCEEKGLKTTFYPEDDSQLEKMKRFTNGGTGIGEAKNLPDDWKSVAVAVDNNPAHNSEMHLVGNRIETVFDPFYVPIAGVLSDEGKFTGATGAFSEVIKKITDPTAEGFIGINSAFLPSIKSQLEAIQKAGYDIDDPKNFGHYVQNTDVHLLLSSLIADRMADEIRAHQGSEDVAIILTGNNHSENVATKLGISKSEMIVISSCENQFAKDGYLQDFDVIPFDIEARTKIPAIPSLITEKLTELQSSKAASAAEEKKEIFIEKSDKKPGSFVEAIKAATAANQSDHSL